MCETELRIDVLDLLGWHPTHHGSRGYIFGDDGARRHHCPIPNRHTRQDRRIRSNPYTLTQGYSLRNGGRPLRRIKIMIQGRYNNIVAN